MPNKELKLAQGQGRGIDRISWLPDEILWRILSLLRSSDEVVRTGVLSTKWKNIWVEVGNLDIDNGYFRRIKHKFEQEKQQMEKSLVNYINKMVNRYDYPCIERLCLSISSSASSTILNRLLAERDVRHLEVCFHENQVASLPESLFISTTLVVLKLKTDYLETSTTIWLPSLKTLHLNILKSFITQHLEDFLPRCPSLEELLIKSRDVKKHVSQDLDLLIQIPTLKRCGLEFVDNGDVTKGGSYKLVHRVAINAPRLEYLWVRDYQTGLYSLFSTGICNLVEAHVDWQPIYNKNKSSIPDIMNLYMLLNRLKFAKVLSLSGHTIQWLNLSFHLKGKLETFKRLMKLELNVAGDINCEFLAKFLSYTPNLEYLILANKVCSGLYVNPNDRGRWTPPEGVPICVLFHLKEIIVEGLHKGYEVEAVKYLLQHSRVLNRLTINCTDVVELDAFKDISRAPRGSVTSEIILQACYDDE
ncbi:F-box/FBD/LRR-repeat protein At4g26340-like [Chenopodium quinoa]|uniref:F-box/FBD/LRR-repeat protein At4g26340-like n=1 Tax=Chenopodium quinoa TaxID=63459 RepID=UPI000B7880F3|nr:F-box/FBD/LRR-repeat protein At4g26340-like [Chenopodium quinoa]